MKNIILGVVAGLFVIACESDDDGEVNPESQRIADEVANVANNGSWTITYFFDDNEDETSDFDGYTFTFGPNGELTATYGSNTIIGTWSVDADDDNEVDVDFNISFSSSANFEELNDDWDIKSYTDTEIELSDEDDGSDDEFLTFQRN